MARCGRLDRHRHDRRPAVRPCSKEIDVTRSPCFANRDRISRASAGELTCGSGFRVACIREPSMLIGLEPEAAVRATPSCAWRAGTRGDQRRVPVVGDALARRLRARGRHVEELHDARLTAPPTPSSVRRSGRRPGRSSSRRGPRRAAHDRVRLARIDLRRPPAACESRPQPARTSTTPTGLIARTVYVAAVRTVTRACGRPPRCCCRRGRGRTRRSSRRGIARTRARRCRCRRRRARPRGRRRRSRGRRRERDVRRGAVRLALADPEDAGLLVRSPKPTHSVVRPTPMTIRPAERRERLLVEAPARAVVAHVEADMVEHDCSLLVVSDR